MLNSKYEDGCDGECYGCDYTECDNYIKNTGLFILTTANREKDTGAFIECGFKMDCYDPYNKEIQSFEAFGTEAYLRLNEYAKEKNYQQLFKSLKYLIEKDYDKDDDCADAKELDYAIDIIENAANRQQLRKVVA